MTVTPTAVAVVPPCFMLAQSIMPAHSRTGLAAPRLTVHTVTGMAQFGIPAGAPVSIEAPACSTTSVRLSAIEFEPMMHRSFGVAPYQDNEALQRFTRAR